MLNTFLKIANYGQLQLTIPRIFADRVLLNIYEFIILLKQMIVKNIRHKFFVTLKNSKKNWISKFSRMEFTEITFIAFHSYFYCKL